MSEMESYIESQLEHISSVSKQRRPLVVISCLAYNHADYIRDALDGFVMQQTSFPVVAIVHDDASSDRTQEIIKEYAEKYPEIILPILERENLYSRHDGSLGRIMRKSRELTGAKYIAMCEGDDYWTDPLKLQKQVDFLESHPDYSLCFHSAVLHYEMGEQPDRLFSKLETREYNIKENMEHWIVATASIVFRRSVIDLPCYKRYVNSRKFVVGDYPLILSCAKEGRLYAFEEPMSVYRLQPTGWTQQKNLSAKNALKLIEQEIEVMNIFGGYAYEICPVNIAKHSRAAISLLFKGHVAEAFMIWRLALRYAPVKTVKANVLFIGKLIRNKSL